MNDFLTSKLRFLESRLVRYRQLIDEAFSKGRSLLRKLGKQ